MQAASHITLKEINQRLNKIENALKNRAVSPSENDNFISPFLPLHTLDNIKEFESILKTTNEAITQFVSIIRTRTHAHQIYTIAFC